MSNHKGHLYGVVIAYTALCVIISTVYYFYGTLSLEALKKEAILHHIPGFLQDAEYTIHYYFPLIISGVAWFFTQCYSALLIGFEWLIFALAGAMFPDIDIKSKSQKYWYGFVFFFLLVFIGRKKLYTVACISIISMLPLFSNHRGLFHRPWFVIALPLCFWYWLSCLMPNAKHILLYDTLFFIAGALSHLYLDMGKKMFKLRF